MPNLNSRRRNAKACPVCGKASLEPHSPFCSQGCRDRDLLQWLGEGYRVAGTPANGEGREIDADGLDSDA